MRVLLAEFAHESNSFATPVTGRERFEQSELVHGEAVIEAHRGKGTVLGGMIESLLQNGHHAIPVLLPLRRLQVRLMQPSLMRFCASCWVLLSGKNPMRSC